MINNKSIYDENWNSWLDMKVHGPSSRWLRSLILDSLLSTERSEIVSIIDVGCGEGTNTFLLAKCFPEAEVTGVDLSATGIHNATMRYNLKNLRYIYDLDSDMLNSSYDMVTSFEVLEHVKDWQIMLARMAGSSKKYLMISTPVGRMRHFEANVGHLRNFGKGQLEDFLSHSGFYQVAIYYAGFPFYSPLYRELCNFTNMGSGSYVKGDYGLSHKMISAIIFFCFRYLSTKKRLGDQFLGLFKKIGQ